ncbi:hypothetical protein AVEN_1309-1 [Araneus ventricosus]|uniref:Uncharacterized protein n=1 Tax=Araneus ventricosus TaxID=182803 RepID=A0A4Y2VDB9_ARAVE|nr:hypothetical protein AVEN_105572-1 [Araneus ventricosus]GBO22592.1 hypothetical protein AVEN_1309-1 [Araneus ventricosus]
MILNSFDYHLPPLHEPQCIVKEHLAIACFLICQLRSDYQRMTHFNGLSLIFRYFLEWPMQKHFITVVNRLRHHLRGRTFRYLLEGMTEKDIRGFKDHDYKKLFMEFWHQTPEEWKPHLNTEQRFGYNIFMNFVRKHFVFVFEENSFDVKAKFRAIIFHQEISEDATEIENAEFFKCLVRERVTTKTSIERFSDLPLGDLIYLIDGILGINPIQP